MNWFERTYWIIGIPAALLTARGSSSTDTNLCSHCKEDADGEARVMMECWWWSYATRAACRRRPRTSMAAAKERHRLAPRTGHGARL